MINVNEIGLAEIHKFLIIFHKNGGQMTPAMIQAWASEAEQHAADGNGCYIEIRASESKSGRPEIYTVPPECIDVEPDDD